MGRWSNEVERVGRNQARLVLWKRDHTKQTGAPVRRPGEEPDSTSSENWERTIVSVIKTLAADALDGLRLSEDLTDRVFLRIEREPSLRSLYNSAVVEHGKKTVHQGVGRHVKAITEAESVRIERSPRSSLIDSYTRLGWPT